VGLSLSLSLSLSEGDVVATVRCYEGKPTHPTFAYDLYHLKCRNICMGSPHSCLQIPNANEKYLNYRFPLYISLEYAWMLITRKGSTTPYKHKDKRFEEKKRNGYMKYVTNIISIKMC
jgi:hypothetical protein